MVPLILGNSHLRFSVQTVNERVRPRRSSHRPCADSSCGRKEQGLLSGSRVQGLGFRVKGLGFRVKGLGFRI